MNGSHQTHLQLRTEATMPGTLYPDMHTEMSTVVDNMCAQGYTEQRAIGIYFEPTHSANGNNGQLSFGGADQSKYVGELTPV